MSRIVALGEASRVKAYSLAGVEVMPVTTREEIEAAWFTLPADTGVLIMTEEVAAKLDDHLQQRRRLLWAVLPR